MSDRVSGISGKTGILAIIGHPVGHSLSPRMQNAAFAALGLDLCYVAFDVHQSDLMDAIAGLRSLGVLGFNVTVPHKEAVLPLLDRVSQEASFIGAVNTVVNRRGKLEGHNTDGKGFIRSLEEDGITPRGIRVLILGSGGASRAVAWHLCDAGAEVFIHSRNAESSARLVGDLRINFPNAGLLDSIERATEMEMILNSTPLGLKPSDPLPIEPELLREGQIVGDLIYSDTPLLHEAAQRGCRTFNGMGMLLWQGALAFRLWTGEEPPVETMRDALLSAR